MRERKFEKKFFKKSHIQTPNGVLLIFKLPFPNGSYRNGVCRALLTYCLDTFHWPEALVICNHSLHLKNFKDAKLQLNPIRPDVYFEHFEKLRFLKKK